MMELLLSLIYSFHLGKWDLLVECILSVIPFTFAYDHINYARYLTALIGDMLPLEDDYPDIYERFKADEFSAQLSDESSFSRCETDKAIEMTLNKDTETPCGTLKPPVVQLSFQLVLSQFSLLGAELNTCFHKHLDYNQQKCKHKDISPSRMWRDERDVIRVLMGAFIDPFGERPLFGISAGIEIPQSFLMIYLLLKKKAKKRWMISFRKD